RRPRDYTLFVAVAGAPVVLWVQFLRVLTHDLVSRMIERTFIRPVISGWLDFIKHPIVYALRPFLAGHLGFQVGFHLVLAMVYWPVLVLCIVGLWRSVRPGAPPTRPGPSLTLGVTLLAIFVLHQLATAAFDW